MYFYVHPIMQNKPTANKVHSLLRLNKVRKKKISLFLIFCAFLLTGTWMLFSAMTSRGSISNTGISIVTDKTIGAPARHGLDKLEEILKTKKIPFEEVASPQQSKNRLILVAGLTYGNGEASLLIKSGKHSVNKKAEALTIWRTHWQQKQVLLISGYDDTGLMYGLLDAAREMDMGNDVQTSFKKVKEITESPEIRDRAVSVYTMNRAYWESRFYDEQYWKKYLDMMAENRFNSLVVIFGYENGGFMAPCYPYFFNTDGYPDVRMVGLTAEQQQHNLAAINKLIDMAHQRGIRFTVGIWDHIYRGGVQAGGMPGAEDAVNHPTAGLVWGVNANNLTAYTKASLTQFIKLIPVDAIQFRMHGESGLQKNEEEAFWLDVFKMIKAVKPELRIDMRAKELPRSVIESAISTGIKFRIATKVWMEQMGLPYHPTRINPEKSYIRHSYGDLLRYPKQYDMYWRLWNGGTNRVLLWGDPAYARRFIQSAHLYEGDGYEINEPLATKMEAQPHDAKPFDLLQPQHRYYQYEFERYWHLFQVFGRLGYNLKADTGIWDGEFTKRFGKTNGPLAEQALHTASWILPRIIASAYPYDDFPTTRGWLEKQYLGDLPVYAKTVSTDLCQFAGFDEEAQMLLQNGETAKIRPAATSIWLQQTANKVLNLVEQIKKHNDTQNKELSSTLVDLQIHANLGLYYSRRIPAAVYYCLYNRTHDVAALDSAIANERRSIDAWRQIVAAAGDYYTDDLAMGARIYNLCGHWKDELVKMEAGLSKLEQQRQSADPKAMLMKAPVYKITPVPAFNTLFKIKNNAPGKVAVGKPITISVNITAPAGVKWARLCYRAVNQQLEYKTIAMRDVGKTNEYKAVIPTSDIDPTYDLMYYIELMDKKGNGRIYPDLNKETPYRIIGFIRP